MVYPYDLYSQEEPLQMPQMVGRLVAPQIPGTPTGEDVAAVQTQLPQPQFDLQGAMQLNGLVEQPVVAPPAPLPLPNEVAPPPAPVEQVPGEMPSVSALRQTETEKPFESAVQVGPSNTLQDLITAGSMLKQEEQGLQAEAARREYEAIVASNKARAENAAAREKALAAGEEKLAKKEAEIPVEDPNRWFKNSSTMGKIGMIALAFATGYRDPGGKRGMLQQFQRSMDQIAQADLDEQKKDIAKGRKGVEAERGILARSLKVFDSKEAAELYSLGQMQMLIASRLKADLSKTAQGRTDIELQQALQDYEAMAIANQQKARREEVMFQLDVGGKTEDIAASKSARGLAWAKFNDERNRWTYEMSEKAKEALAKESAEKRKFAIPGAFPLDSGKMLYATNLGEGKPVDKLREDLLSSTQTIDYTHRIDDLINKYGRTADPRAKAEIESAAAALVVKLQESLVGTPSDKDTAWIQKQVGNPQNFFRVVEPRRLMEQMRDRVKTNMGRALAVAGDPGQWEEGRKWEPPKRVSDTEKDVIENDAKVSRLEKLTAEMDLEEPSRRTNAVEGLGAIGATNSEAKDLLVELAGAKKGTAGDPSIAVQVNAADQARLLGHKGKGGAEFVAPVEKQIRMAATTGDGAQFDRIIGQLNKGGGSGTAKLAKQLADEIEAKKNKTADDTYRITVLRKHAERFGD